jgi:hypothetical protein
VWGNAIALTVGAKQRRKFAVEKRIITDRTFKSKEKAGER